MSQEVKWMLVIGGSLYFAWMLVAGIFPLLPTPWPPFYWALPVHGQVVDAETGAPVSEVIVVAQWELKTQGWSPRVTGQAAVMEDVTDIMGRFSFRWWRPRLRWFWEGHLDAARPKLLFFKSGYKWEWCSDRRFTPTMNPFPGSDCNEARIQLKKFEGNEQAYVESVFKLDQSLDFAFDHDDCSWKRIPHILVAMDQEGKRLKEKGVRTILGGVPNSLDSRADQANERWCGSLTKYMRRYAR